MNTSDKLDKIAPDLLAAQQDMKDLQATGSNPHFSSSFIPLDDMLPAVKPILNRHNIVLVQTVTDAGRGMAVNTRLLHVSGQWIEDQAVFPLDKATPQGAAACITYMRRISLATVCGIVEAKDDDGNKAEKDAARPPKASAKPATVPAGGEDDDDSFVF